MKIVIRKEPDDPLSVLRASCGGSADIGYYLIYRGRQEDVITMLHILIYKMEQLQKEGKPGEEPPL
jgi:hypothetical protein